jgi:uncharacterized protein (TIGR03382 family)
VATAAVIAACFGQASEGTRTQAALVPDRSIVTFPTTLVGMSSSSGPITLQNEFTSEDNTILSIGPSGSCPEFTPNFNPPPAGYHVYCDGGMGTAALTGSGSGVCLPNAYTFDVDFTPSGPGLAGCTYLVTYMPSTGGTQSFPITLSGTGQAQTNSLTINPANGSTMGFGNITQGATSSPQPVTITNNGSSTLSVAGSLTGSYIVTPVGTATFPNQTLLPGGMATYNVACTPGLGPDPGSLVFTSAAPMRSVNLSCTGVAPTALTVSPLPANFASTLVGRAPADVDVTIQNIGAATNLIVTLQANTPELTLTTNPNGQPIASGATAHAILHYTAASERTMTQLGTLNVNYTSGTNNPVVINGEALTGALGVSPGMAYDFGPVCVNQTVTQPVTLYASASGRVTVTSVTPPALPFTATTTAGTLQANHGNMLMLTAGVTPTAPGNLSDKITINTNLVTMPNPEIALTATALPAGVTPTPDKIHFGPAHTMTTTTGKEVIVSNCGTSPITFTSATIEGASAAEFAVVSALPTAAVGQKASTTFLVVMTPQTNGQKAAQLVLVYDQGTIMVDLDGNGFGGGDTSTGDRTTYYACNAGGAGGMVGMLAVGVLVVRRRRRRRA